MVCPHCGCVFCHDYADEAAIPKVYCSAKCGKHASAKRTGLAARNRAALAAKRACGGKRRYHSGREALRVLERLLASDGPKRHERGLYTCPACDGWHLTSKPVVAEDVA